MGQLAERFTTMSDFGLKPCPAFNLGKCQAVNVFSEPYPRVRPCHYKLETGTMIGTCQAGDDKAKTDCWKNFGKQIDQLEQTHDLD
jgi:hypothetical protein